MNTPYFSLAFLAFVILVSSPTSAEVHKWTDHTGRIHYGDLPPNDSSSKPVQSANISRHTALAEVEIEESTLKYFPIYGTTPRELHVSMYANGPFNEIVKQHVAAECGWRIRWKFDYIRERGQCRIGKFKITLSTEITFPKWQNPEAADESVRRAWARVAKTIRTHEDGHKANGIEAANVLARRLHALPAFDTCELLYAEISRAGKRIYAEYALLDRAYDRTEALKSKHGGHFAE